MLGLFSMLFSFLFSLLMLREDIGTWIEFYPIDFSDIASNWLVFNGFSTLADITYPIYPFYDELDLAGLYIVIDDFYKPAAEKFVTEAPIALPPAPIFDLEFDLIKLEPTFPPI